jgi:hypothetical protein
MDGVFWGGGGGRASTASAGDVEVFHKIPIIDVPVEQENLETARNRYTRYMIFKAFTSFKHSTALIHLAQAAGLFDILLRYNLTLPEIEILESLSYFSYLAKACVFTVRLLDVIDSAVIRALAVMKAWDLECSNCFCAAWRACLWHVPRAKGSSKLMPLFWQSRASMVVYYGTDKQEQTCS